MPRKIYLDESGDAGWNFSKPFRTGGSSRYLSIAYLIVPEDKIHLCKRIVGKVYEKFKFQSSQEKKGCDLKQIQREYFAQKIIGLLERNPDFFLGAVVTSKQNVPSHIRTDCNKLYNYMVRMALLDKIHTSPTAKIIRDERNVKVKSMTSGVDYWQTTLWFDYNSTTRLIDMPQPSHNNDNIIFIDWISYIIWSNFENGNRQPFETLQDKLHLHKLFFQAPSEESQKNLILGTLS